MFDLIFILGITSKWIICYLASRKQYVDIQDTIPEQKEIFMVLHTDQLLGKNYLLFMLMNYAIFHQHKNLHY